MTGPVPGIYFMGDDVLKNHLTWFFVALKYQQLIQKDSP
jgi:hypothetical protein